MLARVWWYTDDIYNDDVFRCSTVQVWFLLQVFHTEMFAGVSFSQSAWREADVQVQRKKIQAVRMRGKITIVLIKYLAIDIINHHNRSLGR